MRFLDSVPFLAITGNVPTSQFDRGAFQETYRHYQADFPSTVRAYCKRVFQPTTRRAVADRRAPGLEDDGDRSSRSGGARRAVRHFRGAAAEEHTAPAEWNANISSPLRRRSRRACPRPRHAAAAQRPVILVGQGVRYGGAGELLALAERLRIPVASSASGIGGIDRRIRSRWGWCARTVRYRPTSARARRTCCSRWGCALTTAPRVRGSPVIPSRSRRPFIHVDIDPDEIGRNYRRSRWA